MRLLHLCFSGACLIMFLINFLMVAARRIVPILEAVRQRCRCRDVLLRMHKMMKVVMMTALMKMVRRL